jgi:hypothetical protein
MKSLELSILILVAILFAPIGATSTFAEMQIIESNVPEFPVGQRIPETYDMQLPAGGRVKVIILPATETKIFVGPNLAQDKMKYHPYGGTRGVDIHNPQH